MLALAFPWALGLSVAFHLATGDHHGDLPYESGALGLEIALHGHAHRQGTPDHGHPFVGSVPATIPGESILLTGTMIGDAPEFVLSRFSGRRVLSRADPTHDPPPRLLAVSALRI